MTTLWRGLLLGAMSETELGKLRANPSSITYEREAGIHWTDDPESAYNFAQDRDPEGWMHEGGPFDDEDGDSTYTVGIVLEAEVDDQHILERGSEEAEGYAFSDAILDYGIEREVTVRGGAPVRITKAVLTWVSDEGGDGEQIIPAPTTMTAARTVPGTTSPPRRGEEAFR